MSTADTIPLMLVALVGSVFGAVVFMAWLVVQLNRHRRLGALELPVIDSNTETGSPATFLSAWVHHRRINRSKRPSHQRLAPSPCRRPVAGRGHPVMSHRHPGQSTNGPRWRN